MLAFTGPVFAQSARWDELSKPPFKESYSTPETSARLYDELQFQCAVQVYLRALPGMSMVAMRDGQAATFGGGNNVLAIWKDCPSAKTIVLTANPAAATLPVCVSTAPRKRSSTSNGSPMTL